jgi:hypothetical protein
VSQPTVSTAKKQVWTIFADERQFFERSGLSLDLVYLRPFCVKTKSKELVIIE